MSHVEVELKLAAKSSAIEAVRQCLSTLSHQYSEPTKLTNIYFDTANKQLRQWDMGLRIRGCDGRYEMTMKTAGQAIGGLHQRPEYNVDIDSPELDLAALPAEIWPEGIDISQLQSELNILFSTNFTREKWLVTFEDSEIEVVFDQGEISSGAKDLPIQEFELELKKGFIADVLNLAKKFADIDGLHLSSLSKAARGYSLLSPLKEPLTRPDSLFDYEEQPLEKSLTHMQLLCQQHEAYWLANGSNARQGFSEFLRFVQAFLVHYQNSAPHFIHDTPLEQLRSDIANEAVSAEDFCYSSQWLKCKLAFIQWLSALTYQEAH
ncbi:CYTH domain-containing protein [Providencia rettgeri]|uniref:CYTH domain-containing protein n=1 Tax=Providencia TaxID=586 RepID=UPI002270FB0D|nr:MULTISPECIES: CYTH domain-containing protein [Providencia]MCX9125647.1 CYTH domain-containing protein [Providencia rettgeri]MCX9127672.1 CYTH domain-containing protein [Providencia rettgeri]HEM6846860.1 inorganic triphosphatase [Providencia rettgeri]